MPLFQPFERITIIFTNAFRIIKQNHDLKATPYYLFDKYTLNTKYLSELVPDSGVTGLVRWLTFSVSFSF